MQSSAERPSRTEGGASRTEGRTMELRAHFAALEASLKYEFKCHKEAENSLTHERNVTRGLVELLNEFDLPDSLKSNLLPEKSTKRAEGIYCILSFRQISIWTTEKNE